MASHLVAVAWVGLVLELAGIVLGAYELLAAARINRRLIEGMREVYGQRSAKKRYGDFESWAEYQVAHLKRVELATSRFLIQSTAGKWRKYLAVGLLVVGAFLQGYASIMSM
jgi:hypothetical protein